MAALRSGLPSPTEEETANIRKLLSKTTITDQASGEGTLDINYRFSAVGDQLAAAGYVVSSREYAEGTDPFKMGRRVRALALGKFGIDLDDSASFPRAAQAFIKTGAERAGFFLKHRKRVF